jgi:hypothetical protein
MMKLATAVTTAYRPEVDYLHDTLQSIATAGFPAPVISRDGGVIMRGGRVVQGKKGGVQGAWKNTLRAVEFALKEQPTCDYLVLFQDDLKVARGCTDWLKRQLPRLREIEMAYLFTPKKIAEHLPGGWSFLGETYKKTIRLADSMLCSVFSRRVAELLIEDPPKADEPHMADFRLWQFAVAHHIQIWRFLPSLVQHTGVVSAIARADGTRAEMTEHRVAGEWVEDLTSGAWG